MEIVKIIGIGLTATVIIAILRQYKPEFAIYAAIVAGTIIIFFIMDKVVAIIRLLTNLSHKTGVNAEYLKIILQITGIAILTEFAVSICKDSGETAIANKIDLSGKVIIISMSIPIISALLDIVLKIMP